MAPPERPSPRGPAPGRERSLAELFRELASDASRLVRQEVGLIRAEMRQATHRLAAAASRLGVGAGFAIAGALAIVTALVIVLGTRVGEYWLSALIVGAVFMGVGLLAAFSGARTLRAVVPPEAASTAVRQATRPGTAARRPPREPPSRDAGIVAFLRHVGAEIKEDEVPGHAAKVAYYAFMAMPPALMALFGLAGIVGSERFAAWLQRQAAVAMPLAVSENIIGPFIQDVVLQEAPGPLSIGLILALWGGSNLFLGLMQTLNHAYDVEDRRSFFKKRATAVAIMIGSLALVLQAAGMLLAGPAVVEAIGLGPAGELAWTILQWPLSFVFMVGAFWCAYYFLPNRDQSECRGVLLKAAALAATLWVVATAAFRLYIANFSSYSETYGFLGAFIILLLWLYVTGLVVLAGGELASEMERRPA